MRKSCVNIICFFVGSLILLLSSCSGLDVSQARGPSSARDCSRLFSKVLGNSRIKLDFSEALSFVQPGQTSYGIPRVKWLLYFFENSSKKEIQSYLDSKVIPVSISPLGRGFVSDRHHLLIALLQARHQLEKKFSGLGPKVSFKIEKSFEAREIGEFEDYLLKSGNVYLFKKGKRISIEELPRDFSDMSKDYFRGVAWVLKKMKVIDSVNEKFVEFKWANRLRHVLPDQKTRWKKKHLKGIIKKIEEEPELFSDLPGFRSQAIKFSKAMSNFSRFAPAFSWAN